MAHDRTARKGVGVVSSKKAILAKIRKCLALAKSANENEAAAALAKARELMDAHEIDAETLKLSEIEEFAVRGQRAMRPPRWESLLVISVERALNVSSFIDDNLDRRFVGRGASSEIAGYAFTVLHRQLKKARAEYAATRLKRCKPGRKRQRADVFCEAWASAVFVKICGLVPPRRDDADIDQYLAVHHPGLVTVEARKAKISGGGANEDYWRGQQAGRAVELHQGVGASTAQGLLT
jgi:hypothetical protein